MTLPCTQSSLTYNPWREGNITQEIIIDFGMYKDNTNSARFILFVEKYYFFFFLIQTLKKTTKKAGHFGFKTRKKQALKDFKIDEKNFVVNEK